MATLEVHDDQGRVQFVELARDHPMLFGTSAACDIVLAGEGIAPVHGRIRWKRKRKNYKVEASPEAEYVELNGHKMASASLHQGDELVVGPCRIFVFRLDEDIAGHAARPMRRADEERTQVLQGPPPRVPATAESRKPSQAGAAKAAGSILERNEWLDELGLGQEKPAESVVELPGQRAAPRLGWFRKLKSRWAEVPGEERIASSPMVLGLLLALALLGLMGLGLRAIIVRASADQQFNRAMGALEDGDYRNAIQDFDRFLESHPGDPRAGKAQVRRALANVRQYITVSGGTWSTALEAAREMYESFGELEEFRDERVELAELVIRIGEGLADRSRHSADAKSLQEAESTIPLHAQIAGEPAPAFLKRSRLPGLIDQARAAVRKEEDRRQAHSQMDAALQAGSAAGVYKARDGLVERYADLAQDPELIRRMTQANDLIRQAVKVSRDRKRSAETPRPEVLGPPTSLVLRSSDRASTAPATPESTVYALADGLIYALDSGTGAPLWQRVVGLASPFVPVPIAGTPSVLAVDSRHQDLLRLHAGDGRLIWRLELGEAVESPPLAMGGHLYQVLPSGKLLVITLDSGELQATVELGMPLSQSPVSDEQGRVLYLMGRRDCLFVLARESLACTEVEYLGHRDLSIACAPLRVGRFLIVAENDRPMDSRWRVLVLDEDGSKVRPVQQVDVPGWTWSTPASWGSILWATGDKGGVEAYGLGDYTSKNPLRSIARLNPDASASGPAFGLAVSERELWLAAGRSGSYELDPERGQISLRSGLSQTGPALAPIQLAGRNLVATYQDSETGGVSLHGLEPASATARWQTVLGAAWPYPLVETPDGKGLTCLGTNGKELTIGRETLEGGGFAMLALPLAGEPRLPDGVVLPMEQLGRTMSVLAPREGAGRISVQAPGEPGGWRSVDLPSALAAPPILWDGGLLVPGADGRVYLVDPLTARSVAEPFVPVFSRERRGRWLAPFRLPSGTVVLADDAGRVRLLSRHEKPASRLQVDVEKLLDRPILADPIGTGEAVLVVTEGPQVRALSARDLSAVGAWPLEAPLVDRPVVADSRAFVYDAAGGVMAFDRQGQRLWSIRLEQPAGGLPIIDGELVWLLDRAGTLHGRSLADGSPRRRLDLGITPAGGMVRASGRVFIPSARGSLQPVALEAVGGVGKP